MSDLESRPRATDEQLLQLRGWGASHRQIGAMLGLRRNTVSVRFSRIDRAAEHRLRTATVRAAVGAGSSWWPVVERALAVPPPS